MSKATKGARKALIVLGAIFVAMYGLLAAGVIWGTASWAPGLALDLAGGRQIILTPVLDEGASQEIDQSDLDQAVEIIRNRVDASGVAEAEITTQGNNIVVALPGNPDQSTVDLVAQSAQLQFRPVLLTGAPGATTVDEAQAEATTSPAPSEEASIEPEVDLSSTPQPSASTMSNVVTETDAAETASATDASADPSPSPSPSAVTTDSELVTPETTSAVEPVFGETDPSSFEWLTADVQSDYAALDCTDGTNYAGRSMGDPETGYVACATDFQKVAMGPVELDGNDIETATSGPRMTQQGTLTGDYEVRIQFTSEGGAKFDEISQRLMTLESPRNQFSVVLDGVVISHPQVTERIPGGEASISGNFTQESAEQLANQLKFGALPISLEVQSNQQISATLGADQLQKGLIAGLIGLGLVVIYSVIQYRALGLVTVGSLLIAGAATYGMIALLSWGIDYRLSLAGVAGLIVAIGITADSFIVYFERIRDELREGRSLTSAVDHAWRRARRTILASDAVSLLAAGTLYFLAVGGVRGFAFTLGLTTLIDVLVVFLFTHPVMILLAKTKFFGNGHKWSGLDPRSLGRESLYKGRGRVKSQSTGTGAADGSGAGSATSDGLTLAERKAAKRKAATATVATAELAQDAAETHDSTSAESDGADADGPDADASTEEKK
ncbi:protein translocase subunit SecD [Demequina sediminicola]|uniref:protein translocase subunit SecD n=1 Tax=Demequina sediminicola TaxID=1095026 RepID=UPI000ACE4B2F|nr:protein translocase subunit SecD [Demequina sediminicola]